MYYIIQNFKLCTRKSSVVFFIIRNGAERKNEAISFRRLSVVLLAFFWRSRKASQLTHHCSKTSLEVNTRSLHDKNE